MTQNKDWENFSLLKISHLALTTALDTITEGMTLDDLCRFPDSFDAEIKSDERTVANFDGFKDARNCLGNIFVVVRKFLRQK